MKNLLSPIGAKLVRSCLLFAFSFFLINNVSGQATVTTDKPDYAPLSNAVFTGSGFLPGETVILKVKNLTQPCHTVTADSSYLAWSVTADGEGNFVTPWTVCDCFGDSLRLKATGQTSGLITYAYFTDGVTYPNGISVNPAATQTLCLNSNATQLTATITTCEPTGGATTFIPITYTWYYNTTNSNLIAGATQVATATLTSATTTNSFTPSTSVSGTRYYFCQVTFTPRSGSGGQCGQNNAPGYPFTTATVQVVVNTLPSSVITGPTAVCPSSSNVHSGPGGLSYSWSLTTANGASISAGSTSQNVTVTAGSGNNSSYTLKLVTTNANSCTSSSSQVVTVADNTPPAAPILATVTGQCSASVSTPTTTDNCAGTINGTTSDPTSYSTQGTFTVHWSFNDGNGNIRTANQTVIVDDVTPPAVPTLATVTGQCLVAIASRPTTTDNCAGLIFGTTSDPTVIVGEGTFTVHWSFDDGNGNTTTANQTVIVDDITPPAVPSLATVTGECAANVVETAITLDNCSGWLNGITSDPLSYSTQGTFTVHWSFDDGNGNTTTANQTVIVDDVTPPAVPTLATVTGQCSASVSTPTTTDNCAGTINGTTSDPTSYSTHGTFTVHWSFNDGNGNIRTANQTVIVNDVTPPTISAAGANTTINCPAIPSFTPPTATDACDANPSIVEVSDVTTFSSLCAGNYIRTKTWKAKDITGNESGTVSQSITVKDLTAPVLTGTIPSGISGINFCVEPGGPTIDEIAAQYTDACGGSITVVKTGTLTGGVCGWSVTYHYTIADQCGNSATPVNITYSGGNQTAPELTGVIPSGGTGINACSAPAGPSEADIAGQYTGFCGGAITVVKTGTPTGGVCGWSVTYHYTIKDQCGNFATAVDVTYSGSDQTAPVLTGSLPSDGTGINACSAPAGPSEADIEALYTDACGGAITVMKTVGSQTVGVCGWSVTYHYTIADQCGNPATPVDITYSGSDQTAPVLTGSLPSGGTGINACSAPAGPSEADIAALYEDACGGAITVVKTGTSSPSGVCGWSVTYHYTIADQCGNFATAVDITYSGSDQTAPVLTGSLPSGGTGINACSAPVGPNEADIAALYTDACGGTITVVKTIGSQTVNVCGWSVTYHYTIKDQCGNFATAVDITYSGSDQTAPVVATAPGADKNIGCNPTAADIESAFIAPVFTDNCGFTVAESNTHTVSGCTQTDTRTWTATDGCGNATAVSQTITYTVDTDAPVVATAQGADKNIGCNPTAANIESAFIAPVFTDNCGFTVAESNTHTVSGCTQTDTRTWTATDGCGNAKAVSQAISYTVDTQAPTFTRPADMTIYTDANCGYDASVLKTGDVINEADNCSTGLQASFTDVTSNGTCLGSKIITRTWSLTDHCGNKAPDQVQIIKVMDNTKPVFTNCPQSFTISNCNNVTYSIAATDNCSTPTLSYVFSGATIGSGSGTGSGSVFGAGVTHVIVTATDACGNSNTCAFDITSLTGNLTSYHMVFTDGNVDANWQGATKGFIGNIAVDGTQASERTSGSVPYSGTVYTNASTLGAWQNIVTSNSAQATSSLNQVSRLSGLETELESAFSTINALTVTPTYDGIAPTALNGLNTQNGIAETFVINVTSGFQVSSKINITGDANDLFILRWDTDKNFSNGYNGQVKFQSGGAIVPLGGLTAANFIHVAGDINASGGGSNPAAPYPQGPRTNNGTGALITGGANFNGGGFFTGYWLTTGAPTIFPVGKQPYGQTAPLSNGIFVGGWYSKTTKFSMTSGTSGVYVGGCHQEVAPIVNNSVMLKEVEAVVMLFDVKVYPNPTTSQFRLEVIGGTDEKIVVELYDVLGRKLKHMEKSDGKIITFGNELIGGAYIAEVRQGKNKKSLKLIKQ